MTDNHDTNLYIAITGLADAYGVSEDSIDRFTSEYTQHGYCEGCAHGSTMNAILLTIADAHHRQCDGGDCLTCEQIRLGLEAAMAAVRLNMETALKDMSNAVYAADTGEVVAIGRVAMPSPLPRLRREMGEDTGSISPQPGEDPER